MEKVTMETTDIAYTEPINNEPVINNDNNKHPKLDCEAFWGVINHKDVFNHLLNEIKSINFREFLKLEPGQKLMQKHLIFSIVKNFLKVAKEKQWGLCEKYNYVYIFNGAFWKQCSKDDIKYFLSEAAIRMGINDYDAKHYEFVDKLLKQFLSESHLPTPEVDKDKVLINLHNGTFEFTKNGWQLREFNAIDFMCYQLPFDYIVDAACPLFDKYLKRVLPDANSQLILQEFLGSIFTKLNLEKCLILLGLGGNGKSVIFRIINALIGIKNVLNYSIGLFRHEYNRAKLTNALLNYSSEKGFDLHPDIFKALISGEPLQAREPFLPPFTIYNMVRFIINCNELPRETESTEAYFRRFLILPFDVKITDEEKDIDLADKIIASELPGVFNWMLIGIKRILEQKKFTYCEKSEKVLKDFRKQSDSIQLFIEDKGYEPSKAVKEALTDLYTQYKTFCQDDGYKAKGKNRFSAILESKNFEKTRLNDGSTGFFIIKKQIIPEENV